VAKDGVTPALWIVDARSMKEQSTNA